MIGNIYKQFITEYYNFNKNTNNNFDSNECKFAIYDINKDGYPELFTYYTCLDSIYTYNSENNQVIKISGHVTPRDAQLYVSKTENELIISGWDSTLFRFSYTKFYMDYTLPQILKDYSLVYCILSAGDVEKYGYYLEYLTKTDEIDEETYNNDLAKLLKDKNEIVFYKINSIGNIEDVDLSIFLMNVNYDD